MTFSLALSVLIRRTPTRTFLVYYLLPPAIMADVMVENPPSQAANRRPLPSTIPNFEALESMSSDSGDEYSTLKKLQRELEYVL